MNIFRKFFLCLVILCFFQIIECKKGKGKKTKPTEPAVKVSIIIPVYNTGEFIERSLKSALNQTLKEIEVIVIDDHSTDNTLELVKQFESDKRLKIISLNQNVGIGAARNVGMGMAVGEFLGFIDSDDYADVRFFEFLYKYSKDQDLVGGIYVDSTNLSNKYSHHGKKKVIYYGNTYDSIWRREFVNEHNIRYPISREVGEDVAFRRSFMKANPRKFIAPDEGIYYYYKRRVGSAMNFSNDYIKKLDNKNGEFEDVIEENAKEENVKEESVTLEENILPEKTTIHFIFMGLIIAVAFGVMFYLYKIFGRTEDGLNEKLLKKDSYSKCNMDENFV